MWAKGRPRQECSDAARFWSAIVAEHGLRSTARACGVDSRSVGRWAAGAERCSYKVIERAADWIAPLNEGSLPIYSPQMAIDGDTRVGGVGDYTLYSARGQ
jgi:hypothetical protein